MGRLDNLWTVDSNGDPIRRLPTAKEVEREYRRLMRGGSAEPRTKAVIPASIRWQVWERDDFTCRQCGARTPLSVDHIHPESAGGTLDLDNLQTLCKPCNSRKGARVAC